MSNRKAKTIKSLKDLTLDPANINKGTTAGAELLDRSLANLGAGRSALADADGTIIAGNKTITAAKKLNLPVRVVQTDGKEIVIVQRTDMRFAGSGKERESARQMAAIDNESNRQGYDPDVEILVEQARSYDYSFIYPEGYIEGLIADLTPPNVEFKEYDESVENEVKYHECPNCQYKWPA